MVKSKAKSIDMKDTPVQENEENEESVEKESVEKEEPFLQQLLLKEDVKDKRKLYIILEQAPLEAASINKKNVLLNSDEHRNYISKKLKKDYSDYRPDILHSCLLTLMDSPLNKAGFLNVYVHTAQNVLIYISPNTKLPRTYARFQSLFAQLLKKLKIRAVQSSETLLKIVKNPVTIHIPEQAIKIGTSCEARLVNLPKFSSQLKQNAPVCFVVGAVAKGNPGMEADYIDDCICISKYHLSAQACLSRITCTFEDLWLQD